MSIRLLCCSGSLEGGGSERQLWQLATRIDPLMFSPQIYLHYRRGLYLDRVPDRIPITAFWSDYPSFRQLLPGQIHRRQVQHLQGVLNRERIDVLYDRTFHMSLVTAPACRALKIPRVSVIVSPPSRDFSRSRENFRWLKKWLLARAYRDPLATAVSVSQSVAEDAAKFFRLPSDRLVVIPSPVDEAAVRQASEQELPPGYEPATAGLRIAVVARLSTEKGHQLLFEAARVARKMGIDTFLDIVGDGPERAALQRSAELLLPAGGVKFWGFRDNPFPIMRSADLVCIPSQYEGLANVALESMLLGTPVMATPCGGSMQEVIGENERGVLVPTASVEALAQALKRFVDDRDASMRRVENARCWVLERHGLQPWLGAMAKLFHQAADRKVES